MPVFGATVNRDMEPWNEVFQEIMNRGWHDYMRANRTGDATVDPKMPAATPQTADQMEISKGKFSGLGGRTDFAPENQNVSLQSLASLIRQIHNHPVFRALTAIQQQRQAMAQPRGAIPAVVGTPGSAIVRPAEQSA